MSRVELEAKVIESVVKQAERIVSDAENRAKSIIENARKEAQRLITEAREKAAAIKKEAEEEVPRILTRVLGVEVRGIREKIRGRIVLEGKKTVMEAREKVLSDVFSQVEGIVEKIAMGEDKRVDYSEILIKLIEECIASIGEKEVVIEVSERDRRFLASNLDLIEKRVGKSLGRGIKLRIADKTIDCMGGVIAYNPSKTKVYYNTLEGRLLKLRRTARAAVARILWGEGLRR